MRGVLVRLQLDYCGLSSCVDTDELSTGYAHSYAQGYPQGTREVGFYGTGVMGGVREG